MTCLIAAATAKEIKPFIEHLKEKPGKRNPVTDILITGIGLTAASYHISRQVYIRRPDIVIQAGLSGCFDQSISLGTVLAVKKEAIADQSVIELEQLKTIFDLKLTPQNQYPFKKGWLVNPHASLLKKTKLKSVGAISVNEITTDKKKSRFYSNYFNPVLESMEGAALHYVCLMENIPFLQIRSISNYIGERNKKKWDMQQSIYNLNEALIRVINNFG